MKYSPLQIIVLFTLIGFQPLVHAQEVEISGHMKITERDTIAIDQNIAVFESDGTLAESAVRDLIEGYFLTLPNGVQTLLDAGVTPIHLYNQGVATNDLYGRSYAGGLIFYLDTLDTHPNFEGLVVTAGDITTAPWGCHETDISGLPDVTSTPPAGPGAEIGDGQINTDSIMASNCIESGDAAEICASLVEQEYNDWYLPSILEVEMIYENLHQNGQGDLSYQAYWSSTEFDSLQAWLFLISGGPTVVTKNISTFLGVRAVRSF